MAWGDRIKPEILLNQNNLLNLDDYTPVRGVFTSRSRIMEYEEDLGARLIPDHKVDLLNVLDELAEMVRRKNGGKHTPRRTIEFQNEVYIHRDLFVGEQTLKQHWGINKKNGFSVRGIKKMWFHKKRTFAI